MQGADAARRSAYAVSTRVYVKNLKASIFSKRPCHTQEAGFSGMHRPGHVGKCFGTGRKSVDPTSIIDIDETTVLCKIKMLSRCCGEAPEFLPLPRRTYQQDNSCLLRGPVLPQESSLKKGNNLVRELAGVMVLITAHLKGDYSFGNKAMLQLLAVVCCPKTIFAGDTLTHLALFRCGVPSPGGEDKRVQKDRRARIPIANRQFGGAATKTSTDQLARAT